MWHLPVSLTSFSSTLCSSHPAPFPVTWTHSFLLPQLRPCWSLCLEHFPLYSSPHLVPFYLSSLSFKVVASEKTCWPSPGKAVHPQNPIYCLIPLHLLRAHIMYQNSLIPLFLSYLFPLLDSWVSRAETISDLYYSGVLNSEYVYNKYLLNNWMTEKIGRNEMKWNEIIQWCALDSQFLQLDNLEQISFPPQPPKWVKIPTQHVCSEDFLKSLMKWAQNSD